MLLIRGIFKIMSGRILYIITTLLFVWLLPLSTDAQQPVLFKIKRMSFNTGAFSEISPVILKDGIIFCSDRRYSVFKDKTTFDGRRLYNIYMAEPKDTAEWNTPREFRNERSFLFNNGPLSIAPDGKTVYFTSEVETGKIVKNRGDSGRRGRLTAVQ